ncbi:CRISPR-associated protein Cas4 [Carnobacterium maltaromaticum]|uniref:CRISPR-associated protein Cas4 n=1 Tax=Carnobacterium maltaromaticum TaxID=2751 RepID=UPI00295E3D15|nr:CRISPR-associated protein Cas4 [Carnobacterium maltaromaticum]
MRVTGTMFYYYFVCQRKLWNFSHHITFENTNENVLLGKLLDQSSYAKEDKQILIDGTINVDFIQDWKVVHEVKKSKAIEDASIWQLKYYLYFMQKRGIDVEKGILDFPKIKQRQEVFLEKDDVEKIEKILEEIEEICGNVKIPKVIESKICKKCAYFDYCYS